MENKINNTIIPMNPDAVNYLGYFMSDSENVQNWAVQLFGREVDLNDPRLIDLKNAIEKTLSEAEDDIVKIREFLSLYTPTNNI